MGLSLSIKTKAFTPSENQEWLASRHGTQEADSITLDRAACVAAFPNGFVPSGIPLTLNVGTGRHAPSLDNGAAADDVATGHLFTSVDFAEDGDVALATAANQPAALLWHGEIVLAKVPAYTGRTDLAVVANRAALIRYV